MKRFLIAAAFVAALVLVFLLGFFFLSVDASAQSCTITPNQPAVGAGQTLTFTANNCGAPNPGFKVACQGTGCQSGGIGLTSGQYTGASVSAMMYARGCQIGPNDSIYVHPVNAAAGINPSAYATQWSGRTYSFLAPFHIAGTPGNVSEYDNIVPDSATRMKYNFFEGGISGQTFLEPTPPYAISEAGWSQDVQVNGSFDNHIMSLDPTTCEYDQIYKWYLDLPTASFVANGATTLVNFTTLTTRTLQTPVHVWVYKFSGSCPSNLINGDTGWFATVTSQPNQHSGSGQLSLPVSISGATSGCLITGVDEGNGFAQNTSSLNAQSGAIYPLNSNSLLPGGTNAAQTPIIGIRPDELYNNVLYNIADPNDAGKVTGWHHVVVTTAGNPMIAPIGIWPAQNGTCNNETDHPCISMTGVTLASTAQVTIQAACNGSCIAALNVCSGNPQFSGGQNNCASPSGQQFDVVIQGCPTGSWAALNGQHLTATYVDPEDFTIPVNTSGFGSYPGQCFMYFDWPPYGTIFRLKASFNCEGITNANSALVPYEKAVCRSFQTYGLMLTDGTINSDTWDTDVMSSEFDPDPMHDVFTALETALQCTNSAGTGFSQCLEPVDVSSLDVNGATDGTTNNQRVTVTYTGSTGSASTDVIQQGTTVGVLNRRVTMPAFSGSTYQIAAWINGNTNTNLTYSISPSTGAGMVSSTGVVTPPASVTSVIPATVNVCSAAVSTACDHVQIFYYPVDSDGIARLWLGAKDPGQSGCSGQQTQNFTDTSGKVWWGTWTDPGYLRGWQTNYEDTPGLGFMGGLFGSWSENCSGWSGVANGQLYGTSTQSQANDEIGSFAVPNGSYSVSALIEAGYNTTTAGENVFDWMGGGNLTTPATIFASFQDGYTLTGGQYKGYTAGPFTIPVTDGVLKFGQQIRYWSGSQFEGNSISAISFSPVSTTLQITSGAPPSGQVGVPYSFTGTASGGTGSYSWSIPSGSLPAGLSGCSGSSCVISGTPISTGTSSFTIQVCSPAPTCVTQPTSITITAATLSIKLPPLMPTGEVGLLYSVPFQATGGVPPYTWSTTAGGIPGVGPINPSSGLYSGIPTTPGVDSLTVKVVDSMGTPVTKAYSPILIKPAAAHATSTFGGTGVLGGTNAVN